MSNELSAVLADYRAGLDAQLQLLAQLEALALKQRALPHPAPAEDLHVLGDERQHLLDQLVQLESQVRPLRDLLTARLDLARQAPGFEQVSQRHRIAADTVRRIMALDELTLAALHDAEALGRTAAQALDTGEATLAAYRRVLLGVAAPAGLVDQRG